MRRSPALGMIACVVSATIAACATSPELPPSTTSELPVHEAARVALSTASAAGMRGCCAERATRAAAMWAVDVRCEHRSAAIMVDDGGAVRELRVRPG